MQFNAQLNNASFGNFFLWDMEKASQDCENIYKLGKVLHILYAVSTWLN